MDVREKVLSFFRSKSAFQDDNTVDMNSDYLDAGWLDSMQLVEMIVTFEQEFGIKFSAREMQSEEFRTLEGLIVLLERLTISKGR